jgi:enoyl-CoA hydratase
VEYELPQEVSVECAGSVRVVTLNRPEALNAISPAMQTALISAWRQIASDTEARAVVLTGAGRAFSAGGDLDNLVRQQSDAELRRRSLRNMRRLADELIGFHLPVVAAVNGPAVGLGATLAILSDYVVMSENSYLADTHVSVGLVAGDGGAAFWPLLCGLLRAKSLLLMGERIRPAEAIQIGLANLVVSDHCLVQEATAVAHRLAELPAQAVQDTKRALNLHLKQAADGILDFSLAAESESFTTPDVAAAVARIRDRQQQR